MNQNNKPRQTIQSVERALRILNFLGREGRPVNVKEVAADVGINLGTCYHLVNTMQNEGYLFKNQQGEYALGHQIPFLNNTYMQSLNLDRRLYEFAFHLRNRTLESVYLGGIVGDVIQITAILESPQAIKVNHLYVGYHQHPHARAMTKGILAHWTEDESVRYLRKYATYEKLTQYTPTDEQTVLAQLRSAKERGFYVDEQEFTEGIHGVVAPIFSADGRVRNGIGITMPSDRFRANYQTLIPLLVDTVRQASVTLGYQGVIPFNLDF